MTNKYDLGQGSIVKHMLRLAVPTIVANIINALYNIVDRMYIGQMDTTGFSITGLGITFPIITAITAFASLVGMGGAPKASIALGAKDEEYAGKVLNNSVIMIMTFSVLLTVIFSIVKVPLLYAFGGSDNTVPFANDYLSIYLMGTIFVQFTMGLNPFISAQGLSMLSMSTILIGAGLNIVLDPIFIFGLNMGVKGAAVATVISQAVSAMYVVYTLTKGKKSKLKIKFSKMKPDKSIILGIIALGISPFIMGITESFVNIVLNTTLQKFGGDMYVGAMTILTSILQFAMLPISGLGQGSGPLISYNYGARKFDRVKRAYTLIIIISFISSISICAVIWLFPQMFVGIFTKEKELLALASQMLRIYISGVCVLGLQFAVQPVFIALNQPKVSIFLAVLRKVILIIPVAYILPRIGFGAPGVFVAEPVADVISALTAISLFLYFIPKIIAKAETTDIKA